MSQIPYRANLSASTWPFLISNAGRTVIVRGQDQNYVNPIASQEDSDKDIGVPQIIYCHNVLPTADGFQAVDYNTVVASAAFLLAGDTFQDTVPVYSATGDVAYLAITTGGKLLYYRAPNSTWTLMSEIVGLAGKAMTVARVAGVTYIYFANIGCYTFNFTTNVLEPVTLNGLDPLLVLGILNSQGYMIAYTQDAIAWSSLVDPTDFEPSLATGAGGGNLEQIRGTVVACVYTVTGFIIYSTVNAVVALYSGNDRYPFNFREIAFSGGLIDVATVTDESNAGFHYAYTTSGLQQIAPQETKSIFHELTDFLSSKTYDDVNADTLAISTTTLASAIYKSLAIVADRYLVISYGYPGPSHAIVYDMVMKRFGKLKLAHIKVFEWWGHELADTDRVKTSFALLQETGEVLTVNFSRAVGSATIPTAAAATLFLGKFQLVRSRFTNLHSVEVENVHSGQPFSLRDLPTLDGKNFTTPIFGTENTISNPAKKFYFRVSAQNHTLAATGKFELTSIQLFLSSGGKR